MTRMAKKKPAKPSGILHPFLLSLAAGTGWAALHEPADLTNPGLLGAWLLTALAIALLTRAGLALLAPLAGLLGEALRWQLRQGGAGNKGGAES